VAVLGKERKLGLGVERVDAGVAVVLVGSREGRRRAAMPVAAEVFGEMREAGARPGAVGDAGGRWPIGRVASSA